MKFRLNDLAEVGSSKRIYAKEYKSSGIPFYRGKEIIAKSEGRKIDNSLFISKDRYNTLLKKSGVPKENDILISAVGTIGKVYHVAKSDIPFYFKDGNLIRIYNYNYSLIDPYYLYYLLKSYCGQNAIRKIEIGSTQKAITINELSSIVLDIPSLQKQQEISNKLKKIDALISVNSEINDNLLDIAQNIYHRILFSSQITKTNLRSFATVVMGQSPSSKTYNENKIGIPLLNGAADFRNGIHPSKWTTDPKIIVNKGAYIFGVRATIGLTAKVSKSYAIGRGTGSAIPKDVNNEEILYFILNDMFKKFEQTESGSVYINISKNDFENYKFYIPDRNGLLFFHEKVKPIMDQIYINKKQNKILQGIKATLLSKIF